MVRTAVKVIVIGAVVGLAVELVVAYVWLSRYGDSDFPY